MGIVTTAAAVRVPSSMRVTVVGSVVMGPVVSGATVEAAVSMSRATPLRVDNGTEHGQDDQNDREEEIHLSVGIESS